MKIRQLISAIAVSVVMAFSAPVHANICDALLGSAPTAFGVYGFVSLARDLWNWFTHTPTTSQSLVDSFNHRAYTPGRVRPPEQVFDEVFADYILNDWFKVGNSVYRKHPLPYTYYDLVGRNEISTGDASYHSKGAQLEYNRLLTMYRENAVTAMLIRTSDNKQELLIGKAEPLLGQIEVPTSDWDGGGKSIISLVTGVKLHTQNGIRDIAITDIVRSTNLDIRKRHKVFDRIFTSYDVQDRQDFANELNRLSPENPDWDFYRRSSVKQIEEFKRRYIRNEQIAMLVMNEQGESRLVIGRVRPVEALISRDFTDYKLEDNKGGFLSRMLSPQISVANPGKKEAAVITSFVVENASGTETIPYGQVIRYTGLDLRNREALFNYTFKDFRFFDFGYGLQRATEAIRNNAMDPYYARRAAETEQMFERLYQNRSPFAFLVNNEDFSQSLVVGIPKAVMETSSNGQKYIAAIHVETPDAQVVSIPTERVVTMTEQSVMNYTGPDLRLLAREFSAMPTSPNYSFRNDPNLGVEIRNAMAPAEATVQLAAATLSVEEKIEHIQNTVTSGPLSPLQREGLRQAIYWGNLPEKSVQISVKPKVQILKLHDIGMKLRILETFGFVDKTARFAILRSGVLGVFVKKGGG